MADLYEDYGLEVESDNFGADPQLTPQKTTVVKKGGILGKVVALLLGFTIGAGGVIGGVAGAGYFVASQPIKNTVGAVNNLLNEDDKIDYTQFLTEEYAGKTVLEIVKEIPEIAKKFQNGTGTLNDLNNISPLVGDAVDKIVDLVKGYGVELDRDEMLATPVLELSDYVLNETYETKLSDLLDKNNLTPSDSLGNAVVEDLCTDEDGNSYTVGELMDGGMEGITNTIALESLLIDLENGVNPEDDALIMALAYGNNNRYTVGADNKVTMKQMEFSLIGDKLYDIDNNEVKNAEPGANGVFTVTDEDGKVIYYAAPAATTFAQTEATAVPYLGYKDAECKITLTYKKAMVGDLLGGKASDLFNDLELASLFQISPLDEAADPITLALAYGEESVHYKLEDKDGDGKNDTIEWIDGNRPKTLETLLDGDFSSIMNDLKLGTLLDISPLDKYNAEKDDPDPLMLAIAYGEEGTHYTLIDSSDDNDNIPDTIQWEEIDPTAEEKEYYSARTVEDLTKHTEEIFNDIQLGTVLSVEIDDEAADPLTHALAYGYKDEHYKIENGTVEWLNGNGPRTVEDMKTMGTILDTLRIATVLDVDPLDTSKTPDEMTLAIAYGYEGTHYKLLDTDRDGVKDKIEWLPDENGEPYSPRTINDMENMSGILEEIRLETVLDVDETSDDMMIALAYGREDVHYRYVGGKIEMLQQYIAIGEVEGKTKVYNELGKPLTAKTDSEKGYVLTTANSTYTNADGKTYKYQISSPLHKIETEDGEATVYYLYTENADVVYYTPRTVDNLSEGDIFDTMTLNDILGEDAIKDDLLLGHLGDETIDSLPDAISELTFKQVYPEQIYETRYLTKDGNRIVLMYDSDKDEFSYMNGNEKVLYTDEVIVQYKVDYIKTNGVDEKDPEDWPEDVEKVENQSVIEGWVDEKKLAYNNDDHYYHLKSNEEAQVHLKLTSQWKYLLHAETDGEGEYHDYKLTQFTKLVTNMTNNMTRAKLNDLDADGIVDIKDETLTTAIITQIGDSDPIIFKDDEGTPLAKQPTTLGELTVKQIMTYTADVLTAVNDMMRIDVKTNLGVVAIKDHDDTTPIKLGNSLSATVTIDNQYTIDKVTVKMGGVELTSGVTIEGNLIHISIPYTTSDIEITVTTT